MKEKQQLILEKFRIVKLKGVDFFSILLTLDMAVAQMALDLWEFY